MSTLIISAVLLAAVSGIVMSMVNEKKSGKSLCGCGGCCGGCGGCGGCCGEHGHGHEEK